MLKCLARWQLRKMRNELAKSLQDEKEWLRGAAVFGIHDEEDFERITDGLLASMRSRRATLTLRIHRICTKYPDLQEK